MLNPLPSLCDLEKKPEYFSEYTEAQAEALVRSLMLDMTTDIPPVDVAKMEEQDKEKKLENISRMIKLTGALGYQYSRGVVHQICSITTHPVAVILWFYSLVRLAHGEQKSLITTGLFVKVAIGMPTPLAYQTLWDAQAVETGTGVSHLLAERETWLPYKLTQATE